MSAAGRLGAELDAVSSCLGTFGTAVAHQHPAAMLQAARAARQHAELLEAAAVQHARLYGASWQDVGEALGISRQAAWEQYRPR